MNRTVFEVVVLAVVLALAGCTATAPFGGPDGQPVTTAIYLSDTPMDEFEHLNVTISKIGVTNQSFELEVEQEVDPSENASSDVVEATYEFEYEPEQWTETDVDDITVDLTELQGERAVRVADLSLNPGQYGAVYVEVTEIEGVLKTGDRVEFARPSGKILLSKTFAVEGVGASEFVFDLGVARTDDGYVLLPQANQSGMNIPFVAVELEATNLHLRFVSEVTRGQETTIEVTDNRGNPVQGAVVEVNGEDVGRTDANGRITFTVPSVSDEFEVEVEHELGEVSIEYDFSDATPEPTDTETPEDDS